MLSVVFKLYQIWYEIHTSVFTVRHLCTRTRFACMHAAAGSNEYSRTSIIRTPVCHLNVKGVQINEFVRISELSDKIHYLAS